MNLTTAVLLIFAPVVVNGLDENEQAAKWIEQLGDDDPAVRERATEALIAMGPDILPLVEKACGSDDPEVKSRAEKVAAVLRIKKEVRFSDNVLAWYPDIYRYLAEKPEDARSAMLVFRKLIEWDEESKKTLHNVTDDDIVNVMKIIAVNSFKGLSSSEKIQLILTCYSQPENHGIMLTDGKVIDIEAGWRNQLKETVPFLLSLLNDDDVDVRLRAVYALGQLKALEHAKAITPLLKDRDFKSRKIATIALNAMEARQYAGEIAILLKDDNAEVRMHAVRTLGNMHTVEFYGQICSLMKDSDRAVRASAASALTKIFDKYEPSLMKAMTLTANNLVLLLKENDASLRELAVWTLGTIAKTFPSTQRSHYATAIAALLKDPKAEVRQSAVFALRQMEAKAHAGEIASLLKDEIFYVRLESVGALHLMGVKEYSKNIAPLLKDTDEAVRRESALALATFQATEYASEIVPLLKDENEIVRWCAVSALSDLKATTHVNEITPLVHDTETIVRGWAAVTLIEFGRKDSVPKTTIEDIKRFLFMEDKSARAEAALRALGVGEEEIRKTKKIGIKE